MMPSSHSCDGPHFFPQGSQMSVEAPSYPWRRFLGGAIVCPQVARAGVEAKVTAGVLLGGG